MTVATNSHIEIDEKGRLRVAGLGLPVEYIIAEHLKGATAAQIQESWPHLTMAELYAALAYYYDHKDQIDAEMERDLQEFEKLRAANIAAGKQRTREELERWLRERGKPA